MKQLQSTTENSWVELNNIILTDEQMSILYDMSDSNKDKRNSLQDQIKSMRETTALLDDISAAQAIYNKNKPTIKNSDVYELISVDVFMDGTSETGIINCRINKEHIQIRF